MKILPKLDLNITNKCNFRCTHCAFDSGCIKFKEFSLNKIKEILEDTKKLGGEKIDITGGEPLLRKDLTKIIKIAKKLNYKIELNTNASLLTKNKLKLLKKIKLDSIAISLDCLEYKDFKKIRKVNKKTYNKIIKNIKLAVKTGFKVKINTVIFNSNYKDIPKITEFCIKNKIYEHGLYYFCPIGRGNRSKQLSVEPKEWLRFIRKHLTKYKDKIKISLESPLIEKGKLRNLKCIANAEKNHLQIMPDGNVYPCAILAAYNQPLANLNKTTIKNIWRNKKLWGKYWKDIFQKFKCYGHCVNFKNFKTKDYKNYDFICPIRKFSPGDAV